MFYLNSEVDNMSQYERKTEPEMKWYEVAIVFVILMFAIYGMCSISAEILFS